jgi:hypothetical protein
MLLDLRLILFVLAHYDYNFIRNLISEIYNLKQACIPIIKTHPFHSPLNIDTNLSIERQISLPFCILKNNIKYFNINIRTFLIIEKYKA